MAVIAVHVDYRNVSIFPSCCQEMCGVEEALEWKLGMQSFSSKTYLACARNQHGLQKIVGNRTSSSL